MYDQFGHAGVDGMSGGGGYDPSAFQGFEDIFGGSFSDILKIYSEEGFLPARQVSAAAMQVLSAVLTCAMIFKFLLLMPFTVKSRTQLYPQ